MQAYDSVAIEADVESSEGQGKLYTTLLAVSTGVMEAYGLDPRESS